MTYNDTSHCQYLSDQPTILESLQERLDQGDCFSRSFFYKLDAFPVAHPTADSQLLNNDDNITQHYNYIIATVSNLYAL